MWLELPILCHSENSEELESLGLNIDDELEIRIGLINTNNLVSIYPYSQDNSKTILETGSTNLLVDTPYKDIKEIVHNS